MEKRQIMTDYLKQVWQGRNDTEEGAGALRWHHKAMLVQSLDDDADFSDDYALVGFSCDEGVIRNKGRAGAIEGPKVFREQLRNIAWCNDQERLIDFGDIECPDNDLGAAQNALSEKVAALVHKFKRTFVIGGGHETAVGSFAGLQAALGEKAKIGIINLDAHLDLRTPGEAGASSGTPFFQIRDIAGPDNFYYYCLGVARESNTQPLFDRAKSWGAKYIEDKALVNFDSAWLTSELEDFAKPLDAIYLTIDMDVFPHFQAPGVSAPAVRGVSFHDIERIVDVVQKVAKNCRFGLPLADIVELNPRFDVHGITAKTAAVLATRVLSNAEETGK